MKLLPSRIILSSAKRGSLMDIRQRKHTLIDVEVLKSMFLLSLGTFQSIQSVVILQNWSAITDFLRNC